jgi:replicative DNA helicase
MSLIDKRSIFAVIGCLLKNPALLDDATKYKLTKDDFPEQFHKIIFAAISNLWNDGISKIDYLIIDNYLSNYTLQYQIFIENNGIEYLQTALNAANLDNFDYSYNRIKKFSLLRAYQKEGFDISEIYNDDITNLAEQEKLQEQFDQYDLEDISNIIDKKIIEIKSTFFINQNHRGIHAGKEILELKEELKLAPEVGIPLRGDILNMITRGARLRKLYMRSFPTSVGKTRLAIGDACNLGTNEYWSEEKHRWVKNGIITPTLFITTELEMDEVQTCLLAFLSNIDESKILDGNYGPGEEERVEYAARVLQNGQLYIEYLPNFCYHDVENLIRKYFLSHKIRYFFFDYIHTTIRMLSEVGKEVKGIRLREDNMLHMFSSNLKELCNEIGVFVYTASQLSGDWENKKTANQNVLRGAKALADKLDFGYIGLLPTKEDLDALMPMMEGGFELNERPNLVYHIYKNRRGPYQNTKLWNYVDLSTCRIKNLFLTTNDYTPIPVHSFDIQVES